MNCTTWMSRRMRVICLSLIIGLVPGCVTAEINSRPVEIAPTGAVHQVHAAWENRIMTTPDVVNSGKPLIGLAGRVYLFGQELRNPVAGDGMAIIDLCDLSKVDADAKPQLLERWEIDAATFKRLLRKDTIGWGYTLFLPWNTHRPDITKVQLQVRYVPEKGLPLFSPPTVVTLRNDTQFTVTQRRQIIPGEAAADGPRLPPPPTAAPSAQR